MEFLNDTGIHTCSSCASNSSWGRIGPFCGDNSAPVDKDKKNGNSPGSARSTAPVLHTAALLGVPELIVLASVASFQMALDGV